ncbi:MAG: hypothetical protein P8M79_09650 [Alphaproteobacteria bacterium]|nr:hypothetical protein [Alphaproteobacteria bacterium]
MRLSSLNGRRAQAARIIAAPFSPIIRDAALLLADGIVGMIEAWMTRVPPG